MTNLRANFSICDGKLPELVSGIQYILDAHRILQYCHTVRPMCKR
jgi:hypothetical protein